MTFRTGNQGDTPAGLKSHEKGIIIIIMILVTHLTVLPTLVSVYVCAVLV